MNGKIIVVPNLLDFPISTHARRVGGGGDLGTPRRHLPLPGGSIFFFANCQENFLVKSSRHPLSLRIEN